MGPNLKENGIDVEERIDDPCLLSGRFLASPNPGEEVCITGLSGSFPNSRNVHEFRENLVNKVDMVDGDFRRWKPFHHEIPQRSGKIYDIEKFDAGFFGIHSRQADSLDPAARIFLEKAIEAIFDAGLHPSELEGTRTGVFVGACFGESEREWFYEKIEPQTFGITGCMRSMIANRVSYYLKLEGQSYINDTACSSSLYAVEHAYKAIRNGDCDMAIVGGTNLLIHPYATLQFARLGVLSKDGCCKTFDLNGNGYARAEAIACILLQKTKDSRRIYATIVHAKTNCDGYKDEGITYPSGESQKQLLQEFYNECNIDPRSLSFLEAHGTGTKVGDPEECSAIDDVFCKGREDPLLIGSVKSNMGHSEPVSGLCSITKCIIGMEEGYIPPNMYYSQPREGVKALQEGRIKVVSERTPFADDRGLIGVNSFGFGGGNCHVLLKWNSKLKINGGLPKDDLPRLLCVSGRTEEAITSLTDDVNSRRLDAEYIRLLHEIFRRDVHPHPFRGYTIVSKKGALKTSLRRFSGVKPPLVLAFGSFEDSWQPLAKSLSSFPVFAATIQRIDKILCQAGNGIKITEIIDNQNTKVDPVVQNIMGNIVLHIGIVEILRDLELEPDLVMGYALGELSSAYFDECLSLDQVVLTALEMAQSIKNKNEPSSAYIVKLPEAQVMKLLPPSIKIIWKNCDGNVAISGAPKITQKFVESLQNIGVKVEHFRSGTVTWHSGQFSKLEAELLPRLKRIIPKPKPMSKKFLSASKEKVASPEYFVQALYSEIVFEDLSTHFVDNQVFLEIGSGSLAGLIKNSVDRPIEVVRFETDGKEGVISLLEMLGSLYEYGFNPQIQKLYPKVDFPVGRGTPMISPKIKWNHSQDWYVMKYKEADFFRGGERQISVTLKREDSKYLAGHTIDGRTLFPATAYLQAVWSTLAIIQNIADNQQTIVFENCRFKRATTISNDITEFTVMIQPNSGNFEVVEGGVDVVSGRTYSISDNMIDRFNLPLPRDETNSHHISLSNKDIYKELRLRGYNYMGAFRGIEKCNQDASVAWIKWEGNWVSFLDNLLQIKILQFDTRLLYVPTNIKQVTIDARRHLEYVERFGENPLVPVYVYKDADIIRCGGVELKGVMANSIPRRKQLGEPVLEKYEFVPNDLENVTIEDSIRINMQIGLENLYTIKIKVVELLDEATMEDSKPLAPLVQQVFGDQPLIQTNIIVLSSEKLELENITIEDKKLVSETDCDLAIGTKILQRALILQEAFSALKKNGFILSREGPDFELSSLSEQDEAVLDILTVHNLGHEKLVFFRKRVNQPEFKVIKVSEKDEEFSWLQSLKNYSKDNSPALIYSQNEEFSGILGLFNCVRREPGGLNVRCFMISDEDAPEFDPKHPFYQPQIKKNMSVNIYKDGKWGTYRHLLLKNVDEVETEHCFVNPLTRGDLSSLRWIEGSLTSKSVLPPEKQLVQIYYASLNFRDIMTASGRINADVITMDRTQQECVQGFEFSGRTLDGRRVMGMVTHGAHATLIAADRYLLWDIPEHWTMEQAATVPVVYGTVLYSLLVRGKIRRGDTLLIHSGTGGVGQAAIYIALSYGCTVYTTVGTQEKRDFIKKLFPQLTDNHIGNSRDLTFEKWIKGQTKGRGVDIVLNSLAEEKLIASVRCLAKGGRFLEIGKVDMANNNSLKMLLFSKGCSFHGIMLDQLFDAIPSIKKFIFEMINEGIKNDCIKPLMTNVYQLNELEQAFRFMATGKHMGKVILQIRDEEPVAETPAPLKLYKAIPRMNCNEQKSYIITGGLGGFGLELADWLVLRGARKVVLTSRTGLKTGYQCYRISIWKSYGALIKISTADITTREGCEQLIKEAQEMGPIESIFNLAVVLKDSLLENQNPESFTVSLGPKAKATKYLDEITRVRCPDLRDFVVFSSVACGRGNPGQTNYGMANSIMERICEKRRLDGYPALAIQWGAVGDVGLVAEMMEKHTEIEIGGTLQQRITSCLKVMDTFLRQKETAVVSSMVVAMKKSGAGGADNIIDAVANILGVKKDSVSHHSTLAELGMDSMTAVEIKQTLEREFDVILTAQDIRTMTLAKLKEIEQAKLSETESSVIQERLPTGIELILRNLGDESVATIPFINLPSSVNEDSDAPYVFCFPGIEGVATTLKPVAAILRANVIGIQFCYKNPTNSYAVMAEEAVSHIEKLVKPSDPLNIIGYSWGSIIALEALAMLENKGYKGKLVCLDGSPGHVREMCEQEMKIGTEAELETVLLCHLMAVYLPYDEILKNREQIFLCSNFEERLDVLQKLVSKISTHSPEYQRKAATAYYTRLKELKIYTPNYPKILSPVRLYKPTTLSVQNIAEDYYLSDICSNITEIKVFDGNHITILDNVEVAENINEAFGL